MISAHTASGTKVICVQATSGRLLPLLRKGQIFTIDRMILAVTIDGFDEAAVELVETKTAHNVWRVVNWLKPWIRKQCAYPRDAFDYLALPDSLTSLLHTQPIDAELETTDV